MTPRSRRFLLISHLILPAILVGGASGFMAAPAMACGEDVPAVSPAVDRSFSLKNGLRLGTQEATLLKTLGEPPERAGSGTRCGSNQISFIYAADTVVVLDSTISFEIEQSAIDPDVQHQSVNSSGGPIRYNPPVIQRRLNVNRSRVSADRVIVQLSTQNPELRLSSNIHVGDSLDQVLNVYGQPQSRYSRQGFTFISYHQNNEVLRFKLKDDRIDTVDLLLNNQDRLRRPLPYSAAPSRRTAPPSGTPKLNALTVAN